MKPAILFPLLLAGLFLAAMISLTLGHYPLGVADVAGVLQGKPSPDMTQREMKIIENVVLNIRLPRIIAAILVGAALAVAGTVFQSMFVNPLVSPGVLGVLSGASFGAALGMLLANTWLGVQASAFGFGLAAVMAAQAMSVINGSNRLLMLILGGVISSALFTALLSGVKYLADPYDQLPAIVYWLMGGLSGVDRMTVLVAGVPICIGIMVLMLASGYLNAMSMGDEEARSLGINVGLLRFVLIVLATIISALTVVLAGIVGWVGLLIPHMARMAVGPDNRVLIPAAALFGGGYLLLADNCTRLLFSIEIPIGIFTSLVGIPFFAAILIKTQNGWH